MDSGYWLEPIRFIVSTLAMLYAGAVIMRMVLQLSRADYYNPVCQFIVGITQPLLRPMRRIIPSIGRLDTSSLVLLLAVQLLSVIASVLLQGAPLPAFPALLVLAVMQTVELFLDIYVGIILAGALLSWISPHSHNPAVSLIYGLSEPPLRLARRFLPPIGGLDLSPILVLMALELARMLLLPPLQQLFRLAG